MAQLNRLLEQRAPEETARHLCLGLVQEARRALERLLAQGDDDEALHDFRVALRRLRSLIRAYKPHLKTSISKKLIGELSALASSTNAARDYEVLADHFRSGNRYAEPTLHSGAEYVLAHLGRVSQIDPTVLATRFEKLEGRLVKRLTRYRARLARREEAYDFRSATAIQIRSFERQLFEQLEEASTTEHADALHRSRIRAKRLRYLLEPWRAHRPAAKEIVKILKVCQDLLGELQDNRVRLESVASCLENAALDQARRAQQLALRDPTGDGADAGDLVASDLTPALIALIQRIRQDREESFHQFQNWVNTNGARLRVLLSDFADRLDGPEASNVHRYLLRELPEAFRKLKPEKMDEGFVPGTHVVERLLKRRRGRRVSYERHVYSPQIDESPVEIPNREFQRFWPLTEGHRLEWQIYSGGDPAGWTIRMLSSPALTLAEFRGAPASTEWLGDCLVGEVTNQPKYESVYLAKAKRLPKQAAKRKSAKSKKSPKTRESGETQASQETQENQETQETMPPQTSQRQHEPKDSGTPTTSGSASHTMDSVD